MLSGTWLSILVFTYSLGLARTGGGSLTGEEGSGIFAGCTLNLSRKESGLVWLAVTVPSSGDASLPLSSSGRLKCTRSPILELDRGSLWFTRTPSSLGLGGCSTEGGCGLGGDGCCSIIVRLVMELAEWRDPLFLRSSFPETTVIGTQLFSYSMRLRSDCNPKLGPVSKPDDYVNGEKVVKSREHNLGD